jgi:hypothetical protein
MAATLASVNAAGRSAQAATIAITSLSRLTTSPPIIAGSNGTVDRTSMADTPPQSVGAVVT